MFLVDRIPIAVLVLGFGLLSGCASIGREVRTQAVLVRSEPPGAAIVRDEEVIAHTPAYVPILRARKIQVELLSDDGPIEIHLKTHYRWRESFFGNFVLLTYAPIGWLIDFATGAAWRAQDPAPVALNLRPEDRAWRRPPVRLAIAPPQTSQQGLSDAAGHVIESSLHERRLAHRNYENTLSTFIENGYDFDGKPADDQRQELYYRLGVDAVYESSLESEGDGLIVRGQIKNVYTAEATPVTDLRLSSEDIDSIYFKTTWWSRLLPNSVGIDFVDDKLTFSQDGHTYESSPVGNSAWWAAGLRYLSALDVSNLPIRRPGRSARWQFAFIPKLRGSRQQILVGGLPPSGTGGEEQQYTRWFLGGGYGPELGYQIGRHYFYLDLVPLLYWSETTWKQDQQLSSSTRTGIALQIELGYNYFVSSNWFARLFTRTSSENSDSWKDALRLRLPKGGGDLTAQEVTGGLAIGYRFEPRFHDLRVRKPASLESDN